MEGQEPGDTGVVGKEKLQPRWSHVESKSYLFKKEVGPAYVVDVQYILSCLTEPSKLHRTVLIMGGTIDAQQCMHLMTW
jgi:hypothetical protein